MSSVTSMGTYSKYFVYGGAYYVWVQRKGHSFHPHSGYIYFFFGGFGGGRGAGGGGLQSKVGYFLKR